ncbi:MAG: hypothetical protein GYA24_20495 [Candidatus Lokiarchaeota archaeon]|nr:hypothetical protein [Candidatus Lokiarchaeota archaeon]
MLPSPEHAVNTFIGFACIAHMIVFSNIKNPIADAVMASAKMVKITGRLPSLRVVIC